MNDIVINAGLAKYLCDDEHKAVLEALPPDATIDSVLENLSNDVLVHKALYIQQVQAFWNAQASMAKTFRTQAEDWRKVVETLRQELDSQTYRSNTTESIPDYFVSGALVYLVSSEPLPDGVTAYSNEEGASDDLWDRGMSGGNPSIAIVPLRTAPTVRLTSGRE